MTILLNLNFLADKMKISFYSTAKFVASTVMLLAMNE